MCTDISVLRPYLSEAELKITEKIERFYIIFIGGLVIFTIIAFITNNF